jgi:hypothetical protein
MPTHREYNQQYYQENKETEKSRALEYYHTIGKHKINREKQRQYMREYNRTHPKKPLTDEQRTKKNQERNRLYHTDPVLQQKTRAKVKQWQLEHPQKRKAQRLRQYGMTHEEFISMLAEQGNCCRICHRIQNGDKRLFPVVDHNHLTGKVRGLLCDNCNTGIGYFSDNPQLLLAAADYLNNSSSGAISTMSKGR